MNSRANHRTRGANENKHWRSFSAMNINQSSLTQTKHPSPMPATGKGSVLGIDNSWWASRLSGMARKLRVEYPGAIYHVMNRGDRREAIFKDDADRERFLETLGEVCVKTGWQVHALCLMANHFHLVVETPQGNLVAGMKWFLGTYTSRFNRRHKLFGHLFSGRYKALIVDGSGNGYLKTVCDYVHLNPARAQVADAGTAVAGVSVEQLAGVFEGAGQAVAVVAGGAVAGGVSDSAGQCGGAAGVGGGAGGSGGRRRRARITRRSGGGGVWGRKRFARSCWRR